MATTTTKNYSIFAIPAYLVLTMVPHIYSSTILFAPTSSTTSSSSSPNATTNDTNKQAKSTTKPGQNLYNLANPRSTQNPTFYSSTLTKPAYHKFERARAAHANMFENAPFVVSAILAGVVAKLEAEYMNRMCWAYLGSRVLYIVSYIGVERARWAPLRTVWYMLGNFILMGLWWESGKKVMSGSY